MIVQGRAGKRGVGVSLPQWAPTSLHVIYHQGPMNLGDNDERDVWRVTAAGKDKTNLTGDLDTAARPVAWR